MSYNSHHWGPSRHHNGATSPSGQSTGEGGRHSLEMEPMLSSDNSSSHGHKGNDKIGSALGRLTGGNGGGSSKYHGKRTSLSASVGKLLLIGLACLAMVYLGFGVGRDGEVDTPKSPGNSDTGRGGGPSPTPPSMVRKPNSSGKVDQKQIKESEMPNDDDEPSDEDEEDDKMLDSAEEEGTSSGNNDEESKGGEEEDMSTHKAEVVDRPYAGSLADKEDPKLPESIANAVVEDTAALEDDEEEDDDATQDFAPEEGKDGVVEASPEEKLAQQNLEDDDNVVDDDTVSQDIDGADDDDKGAEDDDGSMDDDDIDNVDEEDLAKEVDTVNGSDGSTKDDDDEAGGNAIAQKLLPGGVSQTPTMDYRIPDTVHKRFIKWSKELHQITEMEEYKGGEPKVNWEWHPRKRKDRFPGVEERVSDSPMMIFGVF